MVRAGGFGVGAFGAPFSGLEGLVIWFGFLRWNLMILSPIFRYFAGVDEYGARVGDED